jgi:hypothetical protein
MFASMFFLLIYSYSIQGQSYTKVVPYTNIQACQTAGSGLVGSDVTWRCAPLSVGVNGQTINIIVQ